MDLRQLRVLRRRRRGRVAHGGGRAAAHLAAAPERRDRQARVRARRHAARAHPARRRAHERGALSARRVLDGSSVEVDDIASALGDSASGVAGSLTMAAVPCSCGIASRLLRARAEAPDVEIRSWTRRRGRRSTCCWRARSTRGDHRRSDPRRFVAPAPGTLDIVDWGEIPLVAAFPPDAGTPSPTRCPASFDGEIVLLPRRTAAVPSLPEAVDARSARHGITPSSGPHRRDDPGRDAADRGRYRPGDPARSGPRACLGSTSLCVR